MPWLDKDMRTLLLGAGVGAGAMLAVPVVVGATFAVGRPLLKAALKHGILAAHRSRERLALFAETVEDVLAEVRAEVEEELAKDDAARSGVAAADAVGTSGPPSEKGQNGSARVGAPEVSPKGGSGIVS